MAGKRIRRWQDLKLGAMPLEKLLAQFQAGNRAKGLSEATIHWYDRMLGEFIRFVGSPKLQDFDDQAAITFLGAQRTRQSRLGRPLSSQTIHGGYRALKAFSSWLYREEFTETDALAGLPAPKRQKKLIEPLTREEVLKLLTACDRKTDMGIRNFTLLVTMLDTGLRASEVLGLTLRSAKLEQGVLKVLGKGNKEREVPIGAETQKYLLAYRDMWRPQTDAATLFVTNDGRPLSWVGLHLMLRRLGQRAGVPRVHAHLLRHTFAVSWVEDEGDPFSLQRILGHTTLDMVKNYVNLANGQIIKAHRRHSPIDRMQIPNVRVLRGGSAGKRKAS